MLNKLKFEVFGKKRDDDIKSEPGSKMMQTYRMKIDESGHEVLVEDDLVDIQQEIDSYEESVNVNNIIARYMAGDESALDRARAFYADVSKVPKNFAQILELNNRAQIAFMELPSEIKAIFGNDYIDFIHNPQKLEEYLTNNSLKYKDSAESEKSEEVKSNESESAG